MPQARKIDSVTDYRLLGIVLFELKILQERFFQHKNIAFIIYSNEFMKKNSIIQRISRKLFFCLMHFLNVDGMFHLQTFQYRRFVILLSASQFFYNTCFFKFSFEFLQRFFNVFAFFYWYYNHVFKIKYVVIKLFRSKNCGAKLHILS